LAAVAILLVAAASYWIGFRSWNEPAPSVATRAGTNIPMPQPSASELGQQPLPEVRLAPAPQVSPAPVREVPIARPPVEKRAVAHRAGPQLKRETPSTVEIARVVAAQEGLSDWAKPVDQPAEPVARPEPKPLKAWPASQSQGAKGRIVRIGAFGSREQAKLGWRRMVRAYPALAHLKATVVSDRNSRGRRFYRFQIGTTSQAHSEVLCQRMGKIEFSCAVVGLPWKPKGVER
jgi:hypothetical protein